MHLWAGQRCSVTWARYSSRKCSSVLSTGFGAARPRPHSDACFISRPSRFSLSRSSSVPLPVVMRSRISSIRVVPSRQGVHLPHDSSCEKVMKNLAMSTMQSSSSRMIMPPLPMIEPALVSVSKSTGRSSHLAGMQPPAGPPVWMALSCLPPATPPPMS